MTITKKIALAGFAALLLAGFAGDASAQGGLFDKIKKKAKEVGEKIDKPANQTQNPTTDNTSTRPNDDVSTQPNNSATRPNSKTATASTTVIFSNAPLAANARASTKINFAASETIYGRMFFDRPISELFNVPDNKNGYINIYAHFDARNSYGQDVTEYENIRLLLQSGDKNKNSVDFDIFPDPARARSNYEYSTFFSWFRQDEETTPAGTHLITVEARGPKSEILASGQFTLVFTDADRKAIAAKEKQAAANVTSATAKTATLPAVFTAPSAPFKDPQLSAAAIKRIFDANGIQVLKVAVEPGTVDYNISRDGLGNIIDKYTARTIWLAYKDRNGACFYGKTLLKRMYEGGGRYGDLDTMALADDKDTPIACENVR